MVPPSFRGSTRGLQICRGHAMQRTPLPGGPVRADTSDTFVSHQFHNMEAEKNTKESAAKVKSSSLKDNGHNGNTRFGQTQTASSGLGILAELLPQHEP